MSVEITDEDDTRETLTDDRHVDPVSKAQRVPPPDPTRADMVAPHEITAVGIEMLISEEAEVGQIQRLNKANAASLRLEEDCAESCRETASRRRRPRRAPPSLRPRAAAPKRRSRRPSARLRASAARPRRHRPPPKPAATAPMPKPTASAPPPAAAATPGRSTRSSAAPAYRRQRLDDKQAEQVLHRLGQLMREVVLGRQREPAFARRAEERAASADDDDPAAEQQPAEVLGERRRGAEQSVVPRLRRVPLGRRCRARDVRRHQAASAAPARAVRTAVVDYVGRLDPEELENKVSNGARRA